MLVFSVRHVGHLLLKRKLFYICCKVISCYKKWSIEGMLAISWLQIITDLKSTNRGGLGLGFLSEVSVRAASTMLKTALNNSGPLGIFPNSLWPVRLFMASFNVDHCLLRHWLITMKTPPTSIYFYTVNRCDRVMWVSMVIWRSSLIQMIGFLLVRQEKYRVHYIPSKYNRIEVIWHYS